MQRWVAVVPLVAGACTWVSDAQFDDRATELEAFRTEFLPASDRVKFLTDAEHRLFWVSTEKPLDEALAHSYDPATDQRVAYEFTRGDTNIQAHYQVSDALVVKCGSSAQIAFDATMSNRQIEMTTLGSDECAVDGRDVYFRVARRFLRWTPGQAAPAQVVDLDAAKVGTGSISFAVLGGAMLMSEGSRLWLIDTTTGTATWLENEPSSSGKIVFDARGAVFLTSKGTTYLAFANHAAVVLDDAIADGGYELNTEHADIHHLDDPSDYALYDDHVIYRGSGGIFAYGLESRKVVDLLLDRGTGFDTHPLYQAPLVTRGGTLFVQDANPGHTNDRPVYRVDLNGRLR